MLTIDRETLIRAVSAAAGVVKRFPNKPSLSHVLISNQPGTCRLYATDTETWISHELRLAQGEPCRLLVPHDRLSAFVRTVKGGKIVFKKTASGCDLACDSASMKIATIDPDDFPEKEFAQEGFTIGAEMLKLALQRTVGSCDADSTRYNLGGVFFDFEDGLKFVSTDGRRGTFHQLLSKVDKFSGMVILPQTAVRPLVAMVGNMETSIDVAIGDSEITFSCADWSFTSRLIAGRFPEWRRAFPDRGSVKASCNAEMLLATIQTAFIATAAGEKDDAKWVDVMIEQQLLTATHEGKVEASTGQCEINNNGDDLHIRLDGKFLIDFLRLIPGDETVKITGNSSENALLLEADGTKHVIMPLVTPRKAGK